MARVIYWDLAGKCGFEPNERWYDHVPDKVHLKMTIINFLWDFSIRTDHELGARSPDLLIVNKREKSCQIIDVAIPENGRVRKKEDEKVEKYQNLAKKV